MKTLILTRALFIKQLIEFRRYIFETVSGLVTLFLFFLALFYGAKAAMAGASQVRLGDTLDALVVGYILWVLAIFTYFSVAQDLIQEAQLGTLEQLAMSPLGLARVVLVRIFTGTLFQLFIMGILLILMMLTTGKWLNLDLLSVLPLAILTIVGVVGLSLVMGGMAIVFKRVQSALQIMQMVFIACLAVPISRFPALKYFPLAWGNQLLRQVMADDKTIIELPARDVGFLAAHAAVYLFVGLAIFKMFEKKARSSGLLGHY